MFEKQINNMIEGCYEELLHSTNKKLKKAVTKIKKDLPNDYEEFIQFILHNMISQSMVSTLPNEVSDEMYEDFMEIVSSDAINLRKGVVFKVVLKGHENELQRKIRIPFKSTLADLGYAILAAFEAEGSHLFSITLKGKTYYCDTGVEEGDYYASEVELAKLRLKEGGKLTMCYDFGDNYNFDITYVETKLYETVYAGGKREILNGKGFGIWEDSHYELDLYYEDPKKFDAFIKKQDIPRDFYPVDSEFDLENANECFEDECLDLKLSYEGMLDADLGEEFEEDIAQYIA